jgi:RNA polymerase sigma factor (sigma-70 family)
MLKELSKHHDEWIRMVNKFGEHNYAEDFVQDMYIRLLKYSAYEKFSSNGKIQKGYVWCVLRSIYFTHLAEKKRTEVVSLGEGFLIEERINEIDENYGVLLHKIDNEMKTWHWYDQMLFKLYKDSDMSMRDIAKETNISLTNIYNTIKHCKDRLRDNVGEDYTDFINEDYELL